MGRRTSGKKMRMKLKAMSEWLKRERNRLSNVELWKLLKLKLEGHYRYYGVSGNHDSIAEFYYKTKNLVFKWMNRRSQKKSFTWQQFHRYLERYPLPKPRLHHNLYSFIR